MTTDLETETLSEAMPPNMQQTLSRLLSIIWS